MIGLLSGVASAQPKSCSLPSRLDPDAAVTQESHHHPTFIIVLFKRNDNDASPIHDVEKIIFPPAGLGIDDRAIPQRTDEPARTYRRMHSHGGDGQLHVEGESGAVLRVCHLIALWRRHPAWPKALDRIEAWPNAHIRVGETYRRNTPMPEILDMSLDHDQPVVLFLEAPIEI